MNENNGPNIDDINGVWDDPPSDTGYRHSDWPFLEDDRESVAGNNVVLDWETSDRITVCTLKHHLDMIFEREHKHKMFGEFYHEEDKEYDRKLKKALRRVLKYFGEEE